MSIKLLALIMSLAAIIISAASLLLPYVSDRRWKRDTRKELKDHGFTDEQIDELFKELFE